MLNRSIISHFLEQHLGCQVMKNVYSVVHQVDLQLDHLTSLTLWNRLQGLWMTTHLLTNYL